MYIYSITEQRVLEINGRFLSHLGCFLHLQQSPMQTTCKHKEKNHAKLLSLKYPHTYKCMHTRRAVIQVEITTLLLDWHSSRLKQVSEQQKRQSKSNAFWREKNSRDLRRYSTPSLCGIFPLKHNKDLTNMSPTKHSLNGNRSAFILLSFFDNRSQTWGQWSLSDAWWAQRTFSLCKWSI